MLRMYFDQKYTQNKIYTVRDMTFNLFLKEIFREVSP